LKCFQKIAQQKIEDFDEVELRNHNLSTGFHLFVLSNDLYILKTIFEVKQVEPEKYATSGTYFIVEYIQ